MILNKTTLACIAFLFSSFLFSQTNIADINFVDFNATATYGSGSGVSVHFFPKGIYKFENGTADNQFVLELSQPGGTFTPAVELVTVNGFFTTTINGELPAGTAPGSYKLRIKATQGMLGDGSTFGEVFSAPSAMFQISATASSRVMFYSGIAPNSTHFNCTADQDISTDPMFGSLVIGTSDVSGDIFAIAQTRRLRISNFSSGTTYKFRRINTDNLSIVDIGTITGSFYQIADDIPLGSYNYEVEAIVGGISSVYTGVFVFHKSTTVLANETSENVCAGNDVEFNIDATTDGIGMNYSGSYYTFDYGDGSPVEIFTHAELLYNNTLSHEYTTVSCAEDQSKFTVTKSQFNRYNQNTGDSCDYQIIGNGAEKKVNVSLAPEALFEAENSVVEICENENISIINLTTLGQFGSTGSCEDDANFYWEITDPNGTVFDPYYQLGVVELDPNNWMVDTNSDGLLDILIPAAQVIPGCWTFRLTYVNEDLCLTTSIFPEESVPAYVMNVQAVPVADFDFLDSTDTEITEICFGETVTFLDKSNVSLLGCQNPEYTWTILPDTGYTFVSPFTATSDSPDVIFNEPGVYNVTQTIDNDCNELASITKEIIILGDPTVEFTNLSIDACEGLAGQTLDGFTLDFLNNGTISPTYSEMPYEPTTFLWTITGTGVTASDYNFVNGTDATSDFPIINFLSYKTYIITIQVNGNCSNSNSAVFTFVYEQTPIITNTNTQQSLCPGESTQAVQFTSDMDPSTTYSIFINSDPAISGYDPTLSSGNTIPVMTLTNSSNVPKDLIYSVVPTVDNCSGGTRNFTFTVNPEPVIPTQTAEICSDGTFIITPANNPPTTIVPANTTYTWTVVDNTDVTGESSETTPQTAISQTLTNTTNTVQTVVYTLTPTSGDDGNCVGEDFLLNVQIDPKPSLDDVNLAAICSGDTFNLTPTNNGGANGTDIIPANTTYTWTVVDANGFVTGDSDDTTGQTSISQTLTNTSNVPQTLVYTVTPTSGDQGTCEGAAFTLTVVVNPEPVIPIQTAEICSDETFTITPSNNPPTTIVPANTTYTWTVVDNTDVTGESSETTPQTAISQTLTNTTNTVQTVVYTLTPTSGDDGNCVGEDFLLNVQIDPKPSLDDVNLAAICSGDTFNLTPTNNGGANGTDIIPANTTYTWTVVDANGFVTGDSDDTTGQTSISQTLTNTSNVPQTLVYTVTPTSGDQGICEGAAFTLTVVVNPTPSISAIASQTICGGTAFDTPNFISDVTGESYSWVLTNTGIPAQVTGYPSPSGNGDIPGGVIENTGTDSYTLIYDVTVDFEGCLGNMEQFSITVEPAPSVNFDVLDQSVCSGGNSGSVNLSSLTPSVEISWSIDSSLYPNISGINQLTGTTTIPAYTLSNSGSSPVELVFIAQAVTTSAGSCIGAPVEYSIIVNPAAEMDPIENMIFCNGETTTEITFSTAINDGTTEYNWTVDTNIGLTPTTGTGLIPVFIADNSTSNPIVATVTVEPVFTNDSDPTVECDGVQQQFTITINPSPQITNAVDSETICSEGSSSSVQWTSSITNGTITTYSWTFVSATAGVTGHSTDPGTGDLPVFSLLSNSSNTVGELVYEVIPSSLGCTGNPFLYTIFINPVIAITNIPASQNLCSNDTTAEVVWENTNAALAVDYNWTLDLSTVPPGTSGLISNGTGNLPAMNVNITDIITANIDYIVTPNFDSCDGAVYTYTLIVEPRPVMDPILPQTICGGSAFTTPTLNADVAGTVFNWELLDVANIPVTVAGYPTDSTQALVGETISNSGTSAYTLTYEFTPSFNGCDGPTIPFDITINPSPIVNLTLDTQEVCSGSATQPFTANSLTDPSTTYQWSVKSGSAALDSGDPNAGLTNQIPSFTVTNTGITPITIEIEVIASTTGETVCPGTPTIHTITVVPDPEVQITSAAPTPICIGGTISDIQVSTTGGTGTVSYDWYTSDALGTLISIHPNSTNAASFNPGVFVADGLFYFVAVANFDGSGCDQAESLVITVDVKADATLTAPLATQTLCETTIPTDLEVTATGGTGSFSYQWFSNTTNTATGGVLISGANDSVYTPDTTTAGTVYYYCVVTTDASGCETISSVSEVIVNEGPSIDTQPLAAQTVCLDGPTTALEVTFIEGVGTPTYQWYSGLTCDTTDLSNPILGATSNTFIPPSTAVASTNYFVILTFGDGGCGPITSECALVTVVPDPEVQITSAAPTPICIGGTISDIQVSTTGGTGTVSYDWYTSDALGTLISIHPNSTNAASFNPGVFVADGLFYFVAVANFDGSGCDQAESLVITVDVKADATLTAPLATQTLCETTIPTDLEVTATGGTGSFSYQWFSNTTNTATGGVLISGANDSVYTPDTTTAGTVYYYCVVTTDASGCETISSVSEVIVNEGPSIDTQPLAAQTVCLDGPTTALEVTFIEGVGTPTYQWYSGLTCDTTDLSNPILGATSNTFIPPSTAVASTNYFVILTFGDGGCGPITSECALVNVGEIPVIDNIELTICAGDTFDEAPTNGGGINLTDIVPTTTEYTWTVTGSAFISGAVDNTTQAVSISQTLVNSTNTVQQVVYTVTPISTAIGSCIGDPFTITVSVNPTPIIANAALEVCSETPFSYSASGDGSAGSDNVPANSTYTWTVIDNPNILGETTDITGVATLDQTLVNITNTPQLVVYTVTATSDLGCVGEEFSLTVTVDPVPLILDTTSDICSGESFAITPVNDEPTEIVPDTTTYTWTVTPNINVTGWSNVTVGETSISQTLVNTNPLNVDENVTYTVTPTSGGCVGNSFDIVVRVIPNPEVSVSIPAQTACSGDLFSEVDFTSSVPNTTYQYELTNLALVPAGIVGYGANITGTGTSFPPLTLTNSTTDPFTLIYSVTPLSDGCNGLPLTFELTINPSPGIIFSEVDQELCDLGTSAAVTLTSSSADVDIQWTTTVPPGLLGVNVLTGTDEIPVYTLDNTTDAPIDLVFTATATTNDPSACPGAEFTYTITVNPTPTIDTIADQIICSRTDFTDVSITSPTTPLAGLTYSWEVTFAGPNLSGFTATSTPVAFTTPILGETIINASNLAEDLVYSLTPFFNGCSGDTQQFTITVNPTPEIFAMVDTICSEDTFVVNPINGDPTNATIVPANTTYIWTVVDNPNVIGDANEAVPQTNISQTLINETNTPQDVIYTVTPVSDLGCNGQPFELTVTVETRPIISDKTDGICSGDTFSVLPTDNSPTEIVPANTLYTWTVIAGPDLAFLTGYSDVTVPTTPISQTLVNSSDNVRTIVYLVTPSSGGCEGLPFELEVTLSPRPFIEDVIVNPICSEDTFVVSPQTGVPNAAIVVPIGTTYTWTVIDNPNVNGDSDETVPQSNISQTLINISSSTQTVEYTVTPLSNGCAGSTFQVFVDVKPRPFIVSGPETQDIQCSGSPFVISPQDGIPTATTLVPAGTQYTWVVSVPNTNLTGWSDQVTAIDNITQTLINTTNTVQQITYTITPEADGCVGPSFDAVITIEPKPFVPNVIVDICDATSFTLSPVNGVDPDTTAIIPDVTLYTWGVPTVTGGITGGSVGVDEASFDTGVLENPTTVFQTAVYTITPIYYKVSDLTTPQCIGDPFTVTVTLSPSPEINEIITNIACSFSDLCGASIDISPIGILPFSYNWTSLEGNPITDPTAEDLVDLCPGTYQLDITDGSNCTYTFQYLVEPPPPVDFTLERLVDISCNNTDVPPCDGYIEMSITGGTLPYSLIEWYTETIPDSGIFDVGPYTNSTNPLELFNACEGNYVLKVLDDNGCLFVSDIYAVQQLNTPIVLDATVSDFNGFNIDCATANSGFVSVDLSGGSGVYNYSFVDSVGTVLFDGTLITEPASILFNNLVAGDYTLTVEDPNCPNLIIENFTLTEPTPLIVTATLVDPILCFGELATYEVIATGGVPPYLGTGFIEVLSGRAVFVVSDSNGCEQQDETVVSEPTQVLATEVVNDALCFGDTGLLIVTPIGGTGILTVSLFDAANVFVRSLLTTQGVAVQFDEFDGDYFYNVIDDNGCLFGPISITINQPDPIEIVNKVITQPDCNTTPPWAFDNGSICITITGGTNPFPVGAGWVDNGGGQWCLTGLSAGTYPLDVTDANGCPLFVPEPDVIITRPPEITAFFTDSLDINCTTDTATQTNVIFVSGGVPPYEITWSGGVWDPATQEVMETSVAGTYTAFVIDQFGLANGCDPIPFVLDPITFFEFGIADFDMTSLNSDFCSVYAIDDPVNFQNTSTGDVVGFTWNFGDGSAPLSNVAAPTHVYDELGIYTIELTVEDIYGCFDTYSETIEVTKGYEIILPTAFTPNGDGINDTMRPVFNCMVKVEMSVYDTWGSLLYVESGDTLVGWDGTIDGNPIENGNYIIVVRAQTFNGVMIDMNGPITLIK